MNALKASTAVINTANTEYALVSDSIWVQVYADGDHLGLAVDWASASQENPIGSSLIIYLVPESDGLPCKTIKTSPITSITIL